MVTQELLDYVQSELARGVDRNNLQQTLVAAGWPPDNVSEALANTLQPVSIPVMTPAPVLQPVAAVEPMRTQGPAVTLEEKVLQIETVFTEAAARVGELGSKQREVIANALKGFEQRKIAEIKKRLLPSRTS